jgi:Asp-tRNA(Asn)/Glu-tRNA(Gln) amidotransferase A subunit family amidase
MNRHRAVTFLLAALPFGVASAQTTRAAAPGRAPTFDVAEASVTDLQRAMTEGRVSAVQLVDAYFARIAAYDRAGPMVNAMLRLNPSARADAAARDAERRAGRVRGPLHGVPVILKDNFDTRDQPTSGGSLALVNHQPQQDAFVVRKLRDAGAVILGKANMHELAAGVTNISSFGGQTRNPYDLSRCPGGSSGGTGAAVAASFGALGWGSDTCGSIRIPAAFGSLFGLRPTMGLFSRDGIVPLALTQDVPGPLARTVSDLAIGLDATIGEDPNDAATRLGGRARPRFVDSLRTDALRGARIGVFTPYFRNADTDVADSIRAVARSLRALGAEVVDVDFPGFDELIAGSSAIILETKFDLLDYFARPGGAPVKSLREIIDRGLYDKALETRHKTADTASARDTESHRAVLAKQGVVRTRIVALLDSLRLDALAYPTSTRKPVLTGDPQLGGTCALSAQTGLPAITMPAGFTADGLPTGLELLGRPFSDARLVAFAYAFEQAGPRRRPPPAAPPLVDGRAPAPVRFAAAVAGVNARFTYEPMSSDLSFVVEVAPTVRSQVTAVVLRRTDAAGVRVVRRLLGPEVPAAGGWTRLLGLDLDAFHAGRLTMAVFTQATSGPAGEVAVAPR